jgi:hypothetical protein
MRITHKGMKYLSSALRVALGAGTVLGGSYVLSRIKERQALETRLDHLEQMVEQLASAEDEETKGAKEQEY